MLMLLAAVVKELNEKDIVVFFSNLCTAKKRKEKKAFALHVVNECEVGSCVLGCGTYS